MNHLLQQTISIADRASFDEYGRPVMGAATEYAARVTKTNKTLLTQSGEQQPVDVEIMVMGEVDVDTDSFITHNGTSYKVLKCKDSVDGRGNTHHKTILGQLWQTPA